MRAKGYIATVNGVEQVLTMSPCIAEDFEEYWEQAKKEKLADSLGKTKTTSFYILRNADKETLGFCGIQFYNHKAIFKSDYVVPQYRKNGLWHVMYDYREWVVRSRPSIKYIEATCTDMSLNLYLKRGAEIIQRLTSLTKVRKSL